MAIDHQKDKTFFEVSINILGISKIMDWVSARKERSRNALQAKIDKAEQEDSEWNEAIHGKNNKDELIKRLNDELNQRERRRI